MFLLDQPFLFTPFLFFVTLLVVEAGYRLSVRRAVNEEAPIHEQIVNARDALRLLLSLLLGFTLAMALPRFDQRRQMIVGEANSIAATYLRAQLLPAEEKGSRAGAVERICGRAETVRRAPSRQRGVPIACEAHQGTAIETLGTGSLGRTKGAQSYHRAFCEFIE
jgi:hypothetical protein